MSMVSVIICDDQGQPTGKYIDRELAHTGEGIKHLALAVLLYNSKGEVLLQLRKHKRFDKLWDLTGATDLWFVDGIKEGLEQAIRRCLKDEYEISEKITLKNLGSFVYFAPDKNQCENENCALIVGEYNGEVKLNPISGYACRWADKNDFLFDIEDNPNRYTPWSKESIKVFKKANFFN